MGANSEDYIPKDLAAQIADAISKGIKAGSRQGFSAGNFMQDMTDQMDDFLKSQKAREVNEKVYQMKAKQGLDLKEAEQRVMSQMAKEDVANNIKILQGKLKNKNLTTQERIELQEQLNHLRQMPALIDSMTESRVKQLKIQKEQEALDKQAENSIEAHERLKGILKEQVGITQEIVDQFRTPEMAKAVFADQLAGKLSAATDQFKEFHHEGLTAGQSVQAMTNSMDLTSASWWLGLSDTKGVMQGIVSEYGNVNALSKETVSELGHMAHKFGMSGEAAAKLNAAMSRIPGETAESATNAMKHVGAMAEMQGIAPGKIMDDMANNTGEMARAGAKGAVAFGESAIKLHKMGVEIGTASKMADSLLDFESSINSQMEASVLLGREINLDKAREMALNNDIAGMTEEIAKNIGGAAEFGKMNRLEQDALAKSVGMSVDELSKMMDAQEESNKYFGPQASLIDNAIGGVMTYGSAAAGFMKENGLLILSTIQLLASENAMKLLGTVYDKIKIGLGLIYQGVMWAINGILNSRYLIQVKDFVIEKAKVAFGYVQLGLAQARIGLELFLNNTKVGMWAKEKAHWAAEKIHMAWKAAKEKLGIGTKAASSVASTATSAVASGASAAASGGGAAAGLTGLATGLGAMGTPQVLFGALNLIVAAPALLLMVAAIPFLIAVSLLGIPAGAGLSGLATGLTAMSNPMLLMAGANLSVFALASVIGVAGIPFLAMIALVGIPAGAGLTALGAGLTAMANPAVAIGAAILSGLAISLGAGIMMMGIGIGIAAAGLSLMFGELAKMPIEQMLLLPVALLGIGAGLGALAVASFFAFPGLLLASWALGGFAAVLALMQPIMEMGGLLSLAEGLTALAGSAGGLSEVSSALLGIGGGLGLMAMAGLASLPIIGALMGLAAVAPALGALGSIFGGGEGGGEDDKMQLIADKLDQLIAVASKGGEVNLDGRKVGQVLKLGLNTSNVR